MGDVRANSLNCRGSQRGGYRGRESVGPRCRGDQKCDRSQTATSQAVTEKLAGPLEPYAYRAHRPAQAVSGLLVGQAFEVTEYNR